MSGTLAGIIVVVASIPAILAFSVGYFIGRRKAFMETVGMFKKRDQGLI